MRDYKIRQRVFNLTESHRDLLTTEDFRLVISSQAIVEYAAQYFEGPMSEVIYPSKSFSVAIIYAHLIEQHFGTAFLESLDESDLLAGNDRFYKRYSEAPSIYDRILQRIAYRSGAFRLPLKLPQVAKTVEFFQQEFQISAADTPSQAISL